MSLKAPGQLQTHHAVPPSQAFDADWVGVGLRQAHVSALLNQRPKLGFVEVHAENYFAPGGAPRAMLRQVRQHYPLSVHGVGLGLGSAVGIDRQHLGQLAELVQEFDPVRVSDHACFCRAKQPGHTVPVHGSDLLPIALTDASLALMVSHIQQVQDALQRPLLVENLSAYIRYADDSWDETAFLATLCKRSGCGLLLDINNLVVNALNWSCQAVPAEQRGSHASQAACAWIDQLAPALVGQMVGQYHLAGHRENTIGQDKGIVIDDHSQAVNASVWRVYRHALKQLGPHPTLVEWDVDLPPFDILLAQSDAALACMNAMDATA